MPQIDRRLEGSGELDGRTVIHSLSGHERNHLFMNRSGESFDDVSLVSGVDTEADSRGFVWFDYDHDGQLDIAMVNANTPLVNLYRNQIDRLGDRPANRFVAVRFVGGNQTAAAATEGLSCRDGFGAALRCEADGRPIFREHRCGEGYGSQNSSTLVVGIGESDVAKDLNVRWPSGIEVRVGDVPAGKLVTVYESADQSPSGNGFEFADYQSVGLDPELVAAPRSETIKFVPGEFESLPKVAAEPDSARLYVTMATWCTACIKHMPAFEELASELDGQLELIGLPVDTEDTPDKLNEFMTRVKVAYPLPTSLTSRQRQLIADAFEGTVPGMAVPAFILTDASGNVLKVGAGIPTRSDLIGHLRP